MLADTSALVDTRTPLLECLDVLNKADHKILFVIEDDRLVASITDGDIRRYMLEHQSVAAAAGDIGNKNPKTLPLSEAISAKQFMKENAIKALPLLDKEGRIVRVMFEDGPFHKLVNAPVVINGGGKGTRLRPLTDILPKPLIPVGNQTISERIMDQFETYGFQSFYMIVNYLGDMIQYYFDHLRDNGCKDYNVSFIRESKPLGTVGGLKLMKAILNQTFILTNCDILVQDDLSSILRHHKCQNNAITVIACTKNFKIPYGIVDTDPDGNLTRIREKPNLNFMTSTGIYVMEPIVLQYIGEDPVDAPDLVKLCREEGLKVGVFPVPEDSWLDMGQFEELTRMREIIQ